MSQINREIDIMQTLLGAQSVHLNTSTNQPVLCPLLHLNKDAHTASRLLAFDPILGSLQLVRSLGIPVISGHLGWVRSIALDPSNTWFCTGSADRTIKIWDVAMGLDPITYRGHAGNQGGGSKRKYGSSTSTGGTSKHQKVGGGVGAGLDPQAIAQAREEAKKQAQIAKEINKSLWTDRKNDVTKMELAFSYTPFFDRLNPNLRQVEDFTVHGCWALEKKKTIEQDYTSIEIPQEAETEFNENNTGIYAPHTYTFAPSQEMRERMVRTWPALSCNWATHDAFWRHEWVKHELLLAHIWGCVEYFREVLAKGEEMTRRLREVIRREIFGSPEHRADKGYSISSLIKIFKKEFDHTPKIKVKKIRGVYRLVEVSFMFDRPNGDVKWVMGNFLLPEKDQLQLEVFF